VTNCQRPLPERIFLMTRMVLRVLYGDTLVSVYARLQTPSDCHRS